MLKSSVKCVSKKYDFVGMDNDISNIYKISTYGGEDAWFIGDNIIGVADGVSGWTTKGVSSAFSNSLMIECKRYSEYYDEPIKILEIAYNATKNNVIGGSSTACIAKLNSSTLNSFTLNSFTLNCANHGDSGLIVVRDKKIIHKTLRDQMKENTPFQLGKWDLNEDKLDSNEHKIEVDAMYNQYGRRIVDTKIYNFDVKLNDIIITATDGFFDNITDESIIESCSSDNLELIVSTLMKKAIHETVLKGDPEYIDDITIIVSMIVNNDDQQQLTSNKRQKINEIVV